MPRGPRQALQPAHTKTLGLKLQVIGNSDRAVEPAAETRDRLQPCSAETWSRARIDSEATLPETPRALVLAIGLAGRSARPGHA